MGNQSIKRQFIQAFVFILLTSFLATLLTWGTAYFFLFHISQGMRPANYYEKQVPVIQRYARDHGDSIVSPDGQKMLERLIPTSGMDYQVIGRNGQIQYGNIQKKIIKTPEEMIFKLNRVDYGENGQTINFLPITGKGGEWLGILAVRYSLEVSALAHDLRTPLTIIQGHAEGLKESANSHPERVERYVGAITTNAERAVRLLKEINDIAEIEIPSFTLHPLPVIIRHFMEGKAEAYDVLCKRQGISFITELEDVRTELHPIFFDPFRIAQVLDNIVANAIRFTPLDGKISWYVHVDEKKILMRVQDTGPGFMKTDLPHVFKKFYQGDPSRSSLKGCTGLGLYTAKVLIEKHDGEISAENNKNGGAVVSFILPSEHVQ